MADIPPPPPPPLIPGSAALSSLLTIKLTALDSITIGKPGITLESNSLVSTNYSLTLPINGGSTGEVLTTDGGGNLYWSTGGGGGAGDVTGPPSSTDNALVRFDSTTGKLIKNSTLTLDNTGLLSGLAAPVGTTDATNKNYVDIRSVPNGGTTLQVLSKTGNTDYDTAWVSLSGAPGIPVGGLTGQLLAKLSAADLDTAWVYPGSANALSYFDSNRVLASIDNITVNSYDGLNQLQTQVLPDVNANLNYYQMTISPSENLTQSIFRNYISYAISPNGGFDFNDVYNTNYNINITAPVVNNYYDINTFATISAGTTINGFILNNGNVNIDGVISPGGSFSAETNYFNFSSTSDISNVSINGYVFNPAVQTGATTNNGTNISVISSNPQIDESINNLTFMNINGYGLSAPTFMTGVNISPGFSGLVSNYTGVNVNAGNQSNIDNFTAYSINSNNVPITNFQGISLTNNIQNTVNSFNGISINPILPDVQYARGIDVNMSNCTPHVGNQGILVIQDITYTTVAHGNNGISIEYFDGSLGIIVFNNDIKITFTSGVDTANDIVSLISGNFQANRLVTSVSGGAIAQTSPVAKTFFTSGTNDGFVEAAHFNGNVSVDGDFSFTGSLALGKLNSFSQFTLDTSGSPGQPASNNSLITQLNVPDNTTITDGDFIGLNTAAIMNIGENSHVTTSLTGITPLGLPAVLSLQTGSTVDRVAAATFAMVLDSTATGGVVHEIDLCRTLCIPNGITTINRLKGFAFFLPFGPVATEEWGIFIAVDIYIIFKGIVKNRRSRYDR
jgi:hypothetical protein